METVLSLNDNESHTVRVFGYSLCGFFDLARGEARRWKALNLLYAPSIQRSGKLKVESIYLIDGYFVIFPVVIGLFLCAIVILRACYRHPPVCYFYALRMPVAYLIMPMGYVRYAHGIFPYAIG
ncbi:hypothetical protein EZS27_018582, partial [termite gut metagenome]